MSRLCILMIFTVTLLTVSKSNRVARFSDEEIEKGDGFIDRLLNDITKDEEFDPYPLEDSAIGFWKKISFVNVSGEAKLHNGYILGLKSLHRPSHCSMREEGENLSVEADLGAGVLDLSYDGTVKFMNWGPTITVTGTVDYLETHMEFWVNSKTGRDGKLKKFTIDEMKGMKVTVTGLGPMNWALNYIIAGTTKIFKSALKNMMENRVRDHIAERLPNYQFPVNDVY